jgi:hypothetical protein
MRINLAVAAALILSCSTLINAQPHPPSNIQLVQLQDLSQVQKQ